MRKHPIMYKTPTVSVTGSGGTKVSYVTGQMDWAEVTQKSERNENIADQTQQGSLLEFKIRYRESLAITDKWLIVFTGADYKIEAITKKDLVDMFYLVTAKALI